MAQMPTLTRRRPPAVARALRDARLAQERATPRAAAAARRGAARRRARMAARARSPEPPGAPERTQTILALIGLGAERVGELGTWAGDRSAALRTEADSAWTNLRSAAAWPSLRSAARITLLEAPAWLFQAMAIAMGLAFVAAGALAAARAALGPATGSDLMGAVLPGLLVVLLAMAAVLMALYRLARGGEDQRPVWLIGVATLMLAVS